MYKSNNVANRCATFSTAIALAITAAPALAGDVSLDSAPPASSKGGDFCSWLSSKPGTLYKSSDNQYIQEVGIFGRFQYQEAWVDGNAAGQKFNYHNAGEIRRFRLGARVKFLNYFHLWANTDLEKDGHPTGGTRDIDYAGIYEAQLLFNAKEAFGMDSFSAFEIGVGKAEIKVSDEVNTSSKKIKTIERSAIANKVFPQPNPMGIWADATQGDFNYYLGVFSTESSPEIADADQGVLFHGRLGYDFTKSTSFDSATAMLTFAHADSKGVADNLIGFDWAAGAAVNVQQGRASLNTNFILGENRDDAGANRDGSFFGLVVMPTYWIVENKFEGVFRYQYQQASSSEGIRLNSRYARNAGTREGIASLAGGRGDSHHSVYLGVNYYLCGDNSKIMAGVEWEDLKSSGTDVYNGITYGMAYRMFF